MIAWNSLFSRVNTDKGSRVSPKRTQSGGSPPVGGESMGERNGVIALEEATGTRPECCVERVDAAGILLRGNRDPRVLVAGEEKADTPNAIEE